jgi:hypothetical protein
MAYGRDRINCLIRLQMESLEPDTEDLDPSFMNRSFIRGTDEPPDVRRKKRGRRYVWGSYFPKETRLATLLAILVFTIQLSMAIYMAATIGRAIDKCLFDDAFIEDWADFGIEPYTTTVAEFVILRPNLLRNISACTAKRYCYNQSKETVENYSSTKSPPSEKITTERIKTTTTERSDGNPELTYK